MLRAYVLPSSGSPLDTLVGLIEALRTTKIRLKNPIATWYYIGSIISNLLLLVFSTSQSSQMVSAEVDQIR